ncbi:hypothetical protein NLX83_24185 [Allokutzneria sp. A3M-2-11 16]|uniref:hypothetical protein n=1 Tax=Allokutzneria sp. A3M-2-11 16 TaxID=2962043 RepID=UPI0020B63FCC|nr:hypothetical protein [Allokutzneria sp. A3M-2-11 16]MCP3802372.1 hypothetical protein [Allokutzneria sp. A3M-2-11 16]
MKSVQDGGFLSDEDMAERRRRFAEHYRAEPAKEKPYCDDGAEHVSIPGIPAAMYVNAISAAQGEIRAWHNANPVGDEIPDWPLLKTSDIQYLRYEAAFNGARVAPLRRIVRMNVASGNGSEMVLYLSNLNTRFIGMTLTPGDLSEWRVDGQAGPVSATTSDFFHAFLGTDNGASSIWLVREHGRRLGITGIEKVVIVNAQNVAIHFSHS